MPEYVTQAKLTSRLGAEQLARTASATGVLDAEATTRITAVCADVNSFVDSKVAGLGIDVVTSIPSALEDCAVRLARAALHQKAWNGYGVHTPKSLLDDAQAARDELEAFALGYATVDGSTPARQVGAQFSWVDLGTDADDDNPRETVAGKMSRLP